MTTLDYIAESLPWASVGLLVGYLIGRGVRDLDVIAEAVNPEESMAEPDSGVRRMLRRASFNNVIGVVVFILAVVTVVQGYVYNVSTQRIADCTRGYSNGFADAIDARSEASTASQNALDDLMTNVGKLASTEASPESRELFRRSLAEYLSKRAEAKKQQQENPYPPAPRDLCK